MPFGRWYLFKHAIASTITCIANKINHSERFIVIQNYCQMIKLTNSLKISILFVNLLQATITIVYAKIYKQGIWKYIASITKMSQVIIDTIWSSWKCVYCIVVNTYCKIVLFYNCKSKTTSTTTITYIIYNKKLLIGISNYWIFRCAKC